MKPFTSLLTLLILISFLGTGLAIDAPSKGRKLGELNVIPPRVLQRCISPKFYKTLLVSPVDGWIVVRATLTGTRLSGARVVRSELGGAYDSLALKLANEILIVG